MNKLLILFSIFVLLIISFTSAQIVRDDTFIPVSSEFCGGVDVGCDMACTTSMLISLNDSKIGTNPLPVFRALNESLSHTGSSQPYPSHELIRAVIKFLITRF